MEVMARLLLTETGEKKGNSENFHKMNNNTKKYHTIEGNILYILAGGTLLGQLSLIDSSMTKLGNQIEEQP